MYDVEMYGVKVLVGFLMEMVDFLVNYDDWVFKDFEMFNIFCDDFYVGKILCSGYNKEGKCSYMVFGVGLYLCLGVWIFY